MAESVDMLEVPSDAWDGVEFTWNISADKFGNYQVETGDEFMLTSAVDAFGDPVSMSNLTVIYYKDVNGDNALDANDLVWNTTPDTTAGLTPYSSLNGRYDTSKWKNGTLRRRPVRPPSTRWTLSPSSSPLRPRASTAPSRMRVKTSPTPHAALDCR